MRLVASMESFVKSGDRVNGGVTVNFGANVFAAMPSVVPVTVRGAATLKLNDPAVVRPSGETAVIVFCKPEESRVKTFVGDRPKGEVTVNLGAQADVSIESLNWPWLSQVYMRGGMAVKMPLLSKESRFPSKYNGGSAVSSAPRRLDVSMTTLFPSALVVSASPTPGARALRMLFVNNWACPTSGRTVRIGCWYHPVVRPSVDPVTLSGVA